ncbi:MAG TPA: UTP--glucose-1-phosphate uridylyltransferase [Candidatus Omnitrophota bacterium]|nr:UTP--glucose-1-phosphate uridylyltransferase [Candidatus Omnitrophota bacterium]HPS36799.1 UTP--glucose-1-phosphate uridylyltransferase [Candidatus Omnitrophota bacterium]
MGYLKKLKRLLAGMVVVTFFATNTLTPAPLVHAASEVPGLSSRISDFKIPAAFGKTTELLSASRNSPVLIHIQEAHANYDAQKNIKAILEHLVKNYGVKLVFVEGAANKLQPELFNFFPQDQALNQAVTDSLMMAGQLTGAEVFLIDQNGTTRDAEGFGVENADAYLKDREAYRQVYENRKTLDGFLSDIYLQWQKQAGVTLNKDLREFLCRHVDFEEERVPLQDWLETLRIASKAFLFQDSATHNAQRTTQSLSVDRSALRESLDLMNVNSQVEWPVLVRYFRLKELGKQIDASKVEKEKAEFLKKIQKILSPRSRASGPRTETEDPIAAVQAAFDSAKKHDLPIYKTRFVFERLLDQLPADFSFEAYPNLKLYIQQMILMSEIPSEMLQKEIREITKRIVEALATTDEAKRHTGLLREYQLLRKLFHLELSREEFQRIKEKKTSPVFLLQQLSDEGWRKEDDDKLKTSLIRHPSSAIRDVKALWERALAFYEGAIDRENHMMTNALRILASRKDKAAVLITGGFHTEGFKEKITTAGNSYIGITPSISEITKEGEKNYINALLGPRAPGHAPRPSSFVDRGSWTVERSQIGATPSCDMSLLRLIPELAAFRRAELRETGRQVIAHERPKRFKELWSGYEAQLAKAFGDADAANRNFKKWTEQEAEKSETSAVAGAEGRAELRANTVEVAANRERAYQLLQDPAFLAKVLGAGSYLKRIQKILVQGRMANPPMSYEELARTLPRAKGESGPLSLRYVHTQEGYAVSKILAMKAVAEEKPGVSGEEEQASQMRQGAELRNEPGFADISELEAFLELHKNRFDERERMILLHRTDLPGADYWTMARLASSLEKAYKPTRRRRGSNRSPETPMTIQNARMRELKLWPKVRYLLARDSKLKNPQAATMQDIFDEMRYWQLETNPAQRLETVVEIAGIPDLDALCRKTETELLKYRNLGSFVVISLRKALEVYGRSLGVEGTDDRLGPLPAKSGAFGKILPQIPQNPEDVGLLLWYDIYEKTRIWESLSLIRQWEEALVSLLRLPLGIVVRFLKVREEQFESSDPVRLRVAALRGSIEELSRQGQDRAERRSEAAPEIRNIVHVAYEMAPFFEAGGVKDVIRELVPAIKRIHPETNISVIMPEHATIWSQKKLAPEARIPVTGQSILSFTIPSSAGPLPCKVFKAELENITVYFIGIASYFRNGYDEKKADTFWEAATFSRAAVEAMDLLGLNPDIVQAHDAQTALVMPFLRFVKDRRFRDTATVYTVHNLGDAYQLRYSMHERRGQLIALGIPERELNPFGGLEFNGEVNLAKGGIVFADKVVTVSRSFRDQTLTHQGGFGLDGVLRSRGDNYVAILNAVDANLWNSGNPMDIWATYSAADLGPKRLNKEKFLRERYVYEDEKTKEKKIAPAVPFDVDLEAPLIVAASRLRQQKGMDWVAGAADRIVRPQSEGGLEALLAVVGTGDDPLQKYFYELEQKFPGRFGFLPIMGMPIVRKTVAAAEIGLVPSRFEPAGIIQQQMKRYGVVPVVRATGGLHDTIVDPDEFPGRGTGFKFGYLTGMSQDDMNRVDLSADLYLATARAANRYRLDPEGFRRMQSRAMDSVRSWDEVIPDYMDVYRNALMNRRAWVEGLNHRAELRQEEPASESDRQLEAWSLEIKKRILKARVAGRTLFNYLTENPKFISRNPAVAVVVHPGTKYSSYAAKALQKLDPSRVILVGGMKVDRARLRTEILEKLPSLNPEKLIVAGESEADESESVGTIVKIFKEQGMVPSSVFLVDLPVEGRLTARRFESFWNEKARELQAEQPGKNPPRFSSYVLNDGTYKAADHYKIMAGQVEQIATLLERDRMLFPGVGEIIPAEVLAARQTVSDYAARGAEDRMDELVVDLPKDAQAVWKVIRHFSEVIKLFRSINETKQAMGTIPSPENLETFGKALEAAGKTISLELKVRKGQIYVEAFGFARADFLMELLGFGFFVFMAIPSPAEFMIYPVAAAVGIAGVFGWDLWKWFVGTRPKNFDERISIPARWNTSAGQLRNAFDALAGQMMDEAAASRAELREGPAASEAQPAQPTFPWVQRVLIAEKNAGVESLRKLVEKVCPGAEIEALDVTGDKDLLWNALRQKSYNLVLAGFEFDSLQDQEKWYEAVLAALDRDSYQTPVVFWSSLLNIGKIKQALAQLAERGVSAGVLEKPRSAKLDPQSGGFIFETTAAHENALRTILTDWTRAELRSGTQEMTFADYEVTPDPSMTLAGLVIQIFTRSGRPEFKDIDLERVRISRVEFKRPEDVPEALRGDGEKRFNISHQVEGVAAPVPIPLKELDNRLKKVFGAFKASLFQSVAWEIAEKEVFHPAPAVLHVPAATEKKKLSLKKPAVPQASPRILLPKHAASPVPAQTVASKGSSANKTVNVALALIWGAVGLLTLGFLIAYLWMGKPWQKAAAVPTISGSAVSDASMISSVSRAEVRQFATEETAVSAGVTSSHFLNDASARLAGMVPALFRRFAFFWGIGWTVSGKDLAKRVLEAAKLAATKVGRRDPFKEGQLAVLFEEIVGREKIWRDIVDIEVENKKLSTGEEVRVAEFLRTLAVQPDRRYKIFWRSQSGRTHRPTVMIRDLVERTPVAAQEDRAEKRNIVPVPRENPFHLVVAKITREDAWSWLGMAALLGPTPAAVIFIDRMVAEKHVFFAERGEQQDAWADQILAFGDILGKFYPPAASLNIFVADEALEERPVLLVGPANRAERRTQEERHQTAFTTLKAYGQEHVLQYWNELNGTQRENLLGQIEGVDWKKIAELYASKPKVEDLDGAEPVRPVQANDPADLAAGEALLREGGALDEGLEPGAEEKAAFAVILAVGGSAQRFQKFFPFPKLLFPVNPVTGKLQQEGITAIPLSEETLYEAFSKKLLAFANEYGHEKMYPLVLMTSDDTHDATMAYLEAHDWFGQKDRVLVVKQRTLPMLNNATGKALMKAKDRIWLAGAGHGDTCDYVLIKPEVKAWLEGFGVKTVLYSNIDNPNYPFDPAFIGAHHRFSEKVLRGEIPRPNGYAIMTEGLIPRKVNNLSLLVRKNGLDSVLRYAPVLPKLTEEPRYGMPSFRLFELPLEGTAPIEFTREVKKGQTDPMTGATIDTVKFERPSDNKPAVHLAYPFEDFYGTFASIKYPPNEKVETPLTSVRFQSDRWKEKMRAAGVEIASESAFLVRLPASANWMSPAQLREQMQKAGFPQALTSVFEGKLVAGYRVNDDWTWEAVPAAGKQFWVKVPNPPAVLSRLSSEEAKKVLTKVLGEGNAARIQTSGYAPEPLVKIENGKVLVRVDLIHWQEADGFYVRNDGLLGFTVGRNETSSDAIPEVTAEQLLTRAEKRNEEEDKIVQAHDKTLRIGLSLILSSGILARLLAEYTHLNSFAISGVFMVIASGVLFWSHKKMSQPMSDGDTAPTDATDRSEPRNLTASGRVLREGEDETSGLQMLAADKARLAAQRTDRDAFALHIEDDETPAEVVDALYRGAAPKIFGGNSGRREVRSSEEFLAIYQDQYGKAMGAQNRSEGLKKSAVDLRGNDRVLAIVNDPDLGDEAKAIAAKMMVFGHGGAFLRWTDMTPAQKHEMLRSWKDTGIHIPTQEARNTILFNGFVLGYFGTMFLWAGVIEALKQVFPELRAYPFGARMLALSLSAAFSYGFVVLSFISDAKAAEKKRAAREEAAQQVATGKDVPRAERRQSPPEVLELVGKRLSVQEMFEGEGEESFRAERRTFGTLGRTFPNIHLRNLYDFQNAFNWLGIDASADYYPGENGEPDLTKVMVTFAASGFTGPITVAAGSGKFWDILEQQGIRVSAGKDRSLTFSRPKYRVDEPVIFMKNFRALAGKRNLIMIRNPEISELPGLLQKARAKATPDGFIVVALKSEDMDAFLKIGDFSNDVNQERLRSLLSGFRLVTARRGDDALLKNSKIGTFLFVYSSPKGFRELETLNIGGRAELRELILLAAAILSMWGVTAVLWGLVKRKWNLMVNRSAYDLYQAAVNALDLTNAKDRQTLLALRHLFIEKQISFDLDWKPYYQKSYEAWILALKRAPDAAAIKPILASLVLERRPKVSEHPEGIFLVQEVLSHIPVAQELLATLGDTGRSLPNFSISLDTKDKKKPRWVVHTGGQDIHFETKWETPPSLRFRVARGRPVITAKTVAEFEKALKPYVENYAKLTGEVNARRGLEESLTAFGGYGEALSILNSKIGDEDLTASERDVVAKMMVSGSGEMLRGWDKMTPEQKRAILSGRKTKGKKRILVAGQEALTKLVLRALPNVQVKTVPAGHGDGLRAFLKALEEGEKKFDLAVVNASPGKYPEEWDRVLRSETPIVVLSSELDKPEIRKKLDEMATKGWDENQLLAASLAAHEAFLKSISKEAKSVPAGLLLTSISKHLTTASQVALEAAKVLQREFGGKTAAADALAKFIHFLEKRVDLLRAPKRPIVGYLGIPKTKTVSWDGKVTYRLTKEHTKALSDLLEREGLKRAELREETPRAEDPASLEKLIADFEKLEVSWDTDFKDILRQSDGLVRAVQAYEEKDPAGRGELAGALRARIEEALTKHAEAIRDSELAKTWAEAGAGYSYPQELIELMQRTQRSPFEKKTQLTSTEYRVKEDLESLWEVESLSGDNLDVVRARIPKAIKVLNAVSRRMEKQVFMNRIVSTLEGPGKKDWKQLLFFAVKAVSFSDIFNREDGATFAFVKQTALSLTRDFRKTFRGDEFLDERIDAYEELWFELNRLPEPESDPELSALLETLAEDLFADCLKRAQLFAAAGKSRKTFEERKKPEIPQAFEARIFSRRLEKILAKKAKANHEVFNFEATTDVFSEYVYETSEGEQYLVIFDHGAFGYVSPVTGVNEGRGDLRKGDVWTKFLGGSGTVQVVDGITGARYSRYAVSDLVRDGLGLGVPKKTEFQALWFDRLDNFKRVEMEIKVHPFLKTLIRLTRGKGDADYLVSESRRVLENPRALNTLLRKVTMLSSQDVRQHFGGGFKAIMTYAAFMNPKLLDGMETWDPAYAELLKSALGKDEYLGSRPYIHRIKPPSNFLASRRSSSGSKATLVASIHFADHPYDDRDGKGWLQDLEPEQIVENSPSAWYVVYDRIRGGHYGVRTGESFFYSNNMPGWHVGVPVDDDGERAQILEVVPFSEELKTRTEDMFKADGLDVPFEVGVDSVTVRVSSGELHRPEIIDALKRVLVGVQADFNKKDSSNKNIISITGEVTDKIDHGDGKSVVNEDFGKNRIIRLSVVRAERRSLMSPAPGLSWVAGSAAAALGMQLGFILARIGKNRAVALKKLPEYFSAEQLKQLITLYVDPFAWEKEDGDGQELMELLRDIFDESDIPESFHWDGRLRLWRIGGVATLKRALVTVRSGALAKERAELRTGKPDLQDVLARLKIVAADSGRKPEVRETAEGFLKRPLISHGRKGSMELFRAAAFLDGLERAEKRADKVKTPAMEADQKQALQRALSTVSDEELITRLDHILEAKTIQAEETLARIERVKTHFAKSNTISESQRDFVIGLIVPHRMAYGAGTKTDRSKGPATLESLYSEAIVVRSGTQDYSRNIEVKLRLPERNGTKRVHPIKISGRYFDENKDRIRGVLEALLATAKKNGFKLEEGISFRDLFGRKVRLTLEAKEEIALVWGRKLGLWEIDEANAEVYVVDLKKETAKIPPPVQKKPEEYAGRAGQITTDRGESYDSLLRKFALSETEFNPLLWPVKPEEEAFAGEFAEMDLKQLGTVFFETIKADRAIFYHPDLDEYWVELEKIFSEKGPEALMSRVLSEWANPAGKDLGIQTPSRAIRHTVKSLQAILVSEEDLLQILKPDSGSYAAHVEAYKAALKVQALFREFVVRASEKPAASLQPAAVESPVNGSVRAEVRAARPSIPAAVDRVLREFPEDLRFGESFMPAVRKYLEGGSNALSLDETVRALGRNVQDGAILRVGYKPDQVRNWLAAMKTGLRHSLNGSQMRWVGLYLYMGERSRSVVLPKLSKELHSWGRARRVLRVAQRIYDEKDTSSAFTGEGLRNEKRNPVLAVRPGLESAAIGSKARSLSGMKTTVSPRSFETFNQVILANEFDGVRGGGRQGFSGVTEKLTGGIFSYLPYSFGMGAVTIVINELLPNAFAAEKMTVASKVTPAQKAAFAKALGMVGVTTLGGVDALILTKELAFDRKALLAVQKVYGGIRTIVLADASALTQADRDFLAQLSPANRPLLLPADHLDEARKLLGMEAHGRNLRMRAMAVTDDPQAALLKQQYGDNASIVTPNGLAAFLSVGGVGALVEQMTTAYLAVSHSA